jgi:hypothetical protein
VAGDPLFVAIHHGTQKRTDLSIESWIVGGEKNSYGLLVCDVGMFSPKRNQNERFSV